MISDVDYYCGWLVFIVLMVLGFIAGGLDGAVSVHKASC